MRMRGRQVVTKEKVWVTYGSGKGKEQSADDGVGGACGIGDLDRHVAADLPDEVGARGEGACGPRIERGARTEVDDTHSLDALPLVPVEQVERKLVGLAVGESGTAVVSGSGRWSSAHSKSHHLLGSWQGRDVGRRSRRAG